MRGPSATRDADERGLRGLAQFRSMSLLCAMQMIFLPVYSVRGQAQTANVIVPDGRTGTSLQTSGSVTNVTTSTVSGNNAFNSFSQFSVGQGNTVNLQLPTGTQNLVNIVRDAPVYVNGTLNSYMNGAIGGNVYFADPKGFVVGRSGVVNVGSLNVSTPTREFTDSVIGTNGQINHSAVGNLMAGSFPVSPDGNIRIYGRVNAQDGVRLTGQNVYVAGASQRDIANLDHATKFAASVNSKGLRSAGAITVSNGSIHIGAVNNARVNGRLAAHSKTATPSNITVQAGNNIGIGGNARLDIASRTGNAGEIRLKAAQNLTVAGGARFNASSKTGNGGLVDFSANGIIDVGRGVAVNVAAPNGKAGTLLFDPIDLVVGDASQGDTGVTLSNSSIANALAGLSAGADYLIQADHSITLAAHAMIDARRLDGSGHSTGNANNVIIDAPNIEIMNGAQILAQSVNFGGTPYADGNVTLRATASDIKLSGQATASTAITVDGKITGGTVSITATSTAVSSFLDGSPVGALALVGSALAGSLLGLNGGYVAASATATININSHADINGRGDVTISAHASETASDPAIASTLLGSLTPVAAGVVVGKIDGVATTNVASGATVNAGGNLEIKALNDATIAVSALAASTSAQIVPTVAYSKGSVTTIANVESGAHIAAGTVNTSGSTLKVRAINNNSFSTSATSVAAPGLGASGGVGGAFAISDITTSVTATLGASLGTDAANRMNASVLVEATSDTTSNSTMASSIAGLPALIAAIERGLRAVTAPTSIIQDHMSSLMPLNFNFKAAAALSLANSTQSATAAIAQNPSGGAPSIYASGNVAVASNVIDRGVRSNATASAITKDVVSGESTAISAAVAWGNFTHNSNAYVGNGVLINAANIAVDATTELPITNTWLKWDGLGAVLSHLNGNLGVGGNILTSYANATADAGDTIGIAGSLNHFVVNNNTTAWVAGSASLTATCTTAACGSSWSAGMDNGDLHSYDASIQIAATTTTASIDAAGNVGTLGFLTGNTSGGSSVGGALNFVQFNTKTIAGISDRATVRAADDIAVNAITSDRFVAVAPTSGKAAGALALNGITSLGFLNNTTHASISSQATVYAPTVGILAQQDLSVVTLAGAMSRNTSGGSAVGLAVAYLGANADTSAYIGDNHSDIRPGPFSADDPFAGTGGGSGAVNVDNLTLSATTSGRITAAAVAASISEPQASSFSDKAGAAGAGATGGAGGVTTAASKIGSTSGSSTEGFSIDLAGSSSISDVSLGTSAYIRNTTVNKYTATGAVVTNTIVQALNDTMLNNGSGSAALNLAGASAQGAAIGGAIAAAMSSNATLAYIYGTTMNNQSSVTVQALNGGSEMVVAIGVAGSKSNAASLSASVGIITDSANAYIESSTITGQSTGVNRALEVDAYQTTNVAIGGGSLYISGGQAGVGIGLTYASIADPTGANATDAHIRSSSISNYDTLLVMAASASVIAAGAASGGAGSNGLAGAIVVSEISPTTTAYISSGATVSINVGRVTVLADSGAVSALDTALGNLVKKSNNNLLASDTCTVAGGTGGQNCIDFGAAALNDGTGNGPGASIISVAGLIQAGKNNVGASIVYNTIATTHSASIANVLMSAGSNGNVSVSAVDSSKIQAVTIGFGLATGQFAGVGGTTISSIANTVSASIGNNLSSATQSSVTARNISVTATDSSSITGTAAVAGASTQGSAAGLALVNSSIANNVSAGVTGSKLIASANVAIGASSNASISTVAVGVAMSSQVGLAGSVATNLMGTNVTASITAAGTNGVNGADVTATNNVGVIAGNNDKAAVFAGAVSISKGAAGGAGSLVTNQITGTTAAFISGANTKVDALGTSTTDTLSVNNGTLVHAFDLGAAHAPTDDTPDLSENQDNVRGLAVVASSHQAVVTNVASLAASSGIAIMINPITNVMSGATRAYIDSAAIDTRLTSSALAPQIEVAASSFSYSGAFGAGIVPPTGNGGGGATVISTTMSRQTFAYITNATVGGVQSSSATVGAVTVKANAEQDASSIAVGFNTGSVGLNVFQATTEAYVDGGALTASSLTVNANNTTGIFSANGSGAYGSQAAIGAAFLVQVSSNRTLAYVGDEYHYEGGSAPHTTALNLSGALDVRANTKNRFEAYAVGGALSTGTAAIAGMANIEIANNTTIAGVYDTTLQSVTGGAAGAVTINATEDVAIKEIAGALAVGASGAGVGVGAAANIVAFKSRTVAESRNSNLNSSGAINVNALSTKEVLSYAVTAGIGGSVGIGATVGVIMIGTNTADPDTQGQQTGQLNQGGNGTIAAVNARTNTTQGSDAVASGTAGNPGNANVTSTYNVSSVLTGGNDSVTAQIAGGTVTGTQVNVGATSANAAKMYLLGAGFAKNAGIGAGIGYTSVNSSVLANLSAIVSAPSVTVAAVVKDASTGPYAGKTIDTEAIAGGAALYFGAQAAVAFGNVANTVTAQLGGQVTGTGGTGVAVMAQDASTQVVFTGGVTGGAAAVGASVATAGRSSSVAAKVLDDATVNVSTLAVGASGAGRLSTTATALGGGILAGVGADAEAHENSSVTAEIGAGSSITTSAAGVGTLVTASIMPNLSSEAIGVSVGGGAVGVAIAKSTVGATVTADVGNDVVFSGGALAVTAMALVPSGGTTTWAKALAGGGGSLIGAQGSYAKASQNATVSAYGGTGIELPNADVVIAAQNDSAQYAEATGLSTGFLALGATVAETSSNAHTYAYLGAPADMDDLNHAGYTGILEITATGTDANVSNATVGAGGTYAGAAAVATTNTTAVTNARFDGGTTDDTLYFGGLKIAAEHTTNYAASGDAYQASTAGVSAGKAQNDVVSTTTAEIGTHLIINSAGGDMVVTSNDIVNQAGGGARSGSGGSFSGAAALSDSHVTQTVTTNIGAGTILSLNGDPRTSTGVIDIEAYNTLNTRDTASLATASFFAGGGAESNMTANATLTVNINARELFSVGKIFVGTAAKMAASNNANASLYGAIAGVGASTNSWVHANQAVNVGSGTIIQAWRDINIFAGMSGDTITFSSIQATATTVVYNNTAIPISTLYRGTANAGGDSTVTLADGSRVLGVRDIYLGATQGQVTASGNGSNYNPYLDIFSAKNSDNHSHTSGTGDVALNGLVVAGINNDVLITIDLGASAPTLSTTSPYSSLSPNLEYVSDVDHFSPVKSWNHQTVQYTVVGGFNPYQNVVNQLVGLTGLTETQVRSALAIRTPTPTMAPSGADPTGDIQRQINALIQQAPYTSDAPGSAFAFGDMLVSAGNVSILAQKLTGNSLAGHSAPAVIARGSPMIKVENRGLDFMDFANLTVTNVTGGNITYRQIDHVDPDSHSNVTFTATPSATPIIDISATYNRVDPDSGLGVDGNGNQLTRKPDIYFDGIVTNEGGLLKITNNLGSIVASQSLNAATIQMVAPNGSFVFLGGVGSFYNSNHDVTAQWAGVQYKPANNDTLTAVMAAATFLGAYGAYEYSPHIGAGGNHPYFYYCCVDGNSGVQQTAANSTIFTARMLMTYYDGLSLYSAIFLPMGSGAPGNGNPNAGSVGSVATLAAMEGPTVQTISTAPWERNTYTGQGVFSNTTYDYTTTSTDAQGNTVTTNHTSTFYSPFNCSGCAAYFQVVNIQNDVITPRTANTNAQSNWSSTTPSGYQNPADAPFILGQAIIISAGVINVNGLIQSGTSSNYSVDIGGGALSAINSLKNDSAAFAQAQANARNGSYYDITAAATTQVASDLKIGVRYNALTDQILVNGVVQGSGGYVYLNGKIISTSTENGVSQGTIAVKGGAGSITVNNTTGLQLVTNTINTGVSAPSVIQIVDQLQQQTTWYVYNPSAAGAQQVSTYRTAGVNASAYTGAMLTGMSGTAGIQYAVKPNMYYQWVDTATLDRPTTSTQFDYGWHYTPNAATGENWTRTVSLVENVMQATGGGGNTGQLQTANFQEVITATGSYHNAGGNTHPEKCCGADGQYNWYQQIYDHLTLTLTNTVKASNPINIQFSGGGASTVNVSSNSGIVINGPINNLSGSTTMIATGANSAITSAPNATNPMISGKNVTLLADGGIGSLGANGRPVEVQVYGGNLTATSIDRDIAIAAVGALSINQVAVNSGVSGRAPQGSVFISATGDINSAAAYNVASPVVIGKNVEINSSAGAIGATSAVVNGASTLTNINPLVIQATGTTQPDGTVDGGILDSASATGTYIVQSKGDLRLGTVQSTGGPVFLEAAGSDGNHASILNGRPAVGLTPAQSQHLQDVWASLDLLSGNAATNAVNSYQSMVTSAYNDYFQLRNIAFPNGSTYAPTSVGLTVLRAQVAAKLGIDPADVTATQMKTEATTRFLRDQFLLGQISTDQLKSSLTTLLGSAPADPLGTLFGSSLSSTLFTKLFDGVSTANQRLPSNTALQTALNAYNASYSYTLASTERVYGIITAGSQWTQSQLAYTVSSSAVGAAPPPIDDNVIANVSANQIMLYALRGSVGNSAAPQTFTFTSVDSSSLTPEQRGLLATAGPGQLTVGAVIDPTTHVTTYTVSLSQQNLVVVDNPIAISAKALTNVYLGSKNNLALGGVTVSYGPIAAAQANGIEVTGRGDVKLDAVTGISANAGGAVISGDIANLTLIAERGNVGASANALQIAFADPGNDQLDQVSSAQGIYVKQTTGDLILGNISAGNAIQLAATGSIYAEAGFTDRDAIHILGTDLDLRAGGHIGFNGGAFQPLQVNISGTVTGSAVGDLSILAVTGDLVVGSSGTFGMLTAGGALTLNVARGALTVNAGIASGGLMQLLANRGMIFAAGTGVAPVVATSSSDGVTLVAATLSMGAYSAINAAGLISLTTTGDATIGQLNSSLSYAAASNSPSIIVTAGGVASLGAIVDNGDGQTKFAASGAGAGLSLTASNGIGNATSRFVLSAARLSASTSAGDIYVEALTDTEASLLSAAKGSVDIIGSGGLTLDQVLAGTATGASGSFRAVASNGSIVIGTADSSGSQTVHATENVTFKLLATTGHSGDVGNINVTADTGFILAQTATSGGVTTLGSVSAHGSASLLAATTITGNTLAAATGSGLLTAGGPINWNTLNVGTTLGATAEQGGITFQTARSGGTQTVHARDNVIFNALTATGINGDAGSINVTADNGFILAQMATSGGVPTLGSVSANGSARLIAAGTNTGHNLTASTGNAVLSGTVVQWDNLDAGGSLGVTATTGAINLGTAVSGGTQTLHAVNDIVFSQLTTTGIPGDIGDVDLRSDTGAIRGGSISANGDTHFVSAGPVSLDRIRGNTIKMTSPGELTIGWVSVVKQLDLAADTINVKGEQIRSTPAIPLVMNITGYNGGVAKSADVAIDPELIIINQFRVVDATFWTDAPAVSIINGYVPGQLMLTTANAQVLLNNRTPAPSNWPALQLYQPGGVFTMSQAGNANVSNAYVVFYTGNISATVTNYGPSHTCCYDFTGASMVRNISVDGAGNESIETWLAKKDVGTFYLLGLSGQARLDALLMPRPVDAVGNGPAVNIEGLSEERKLRQKGQRVDRAGWKDAAVQTVKPAVSRLAEAW
ncbi:leukotoxin LktA family filamentous adhesin [Bradyrhizobium sp. WBOS7]|uniref:Leukotoxin LktA family filamentous adhesin n=1 Tax=Bradyrhizobium betae TaxID=244734 RepID=A0AAE9SRX5_9BRAD|nr:MULTISPECIES: leukotoxin LktA family filamentous adhesin [Bradyrhizobium]MDD1571835.1 leukotoxin LktA family filamentous adhesin [Bradyrhizobium sp. WBOS1]UUO36230.1 leukotoxin LktA family filamentous adhesin [Bradyrhizobium sp. WBOS01]MDD1526699.1 leukotoxin LktA family filamentous adhesin [Bradyrhizobium sp. WBOS2]MDD1575339.1 leukotoxin LktA family filamentous adhesin [Bradyrhizobium sp. WBOS7]MDD1600802.1 leukotoxin LktA family filamentous adhesin [Bradyrhizobium sp. WBOS16]